MNMFSEQNVARISFLCAVILVAILTVSSGLLFIANKFDTLNKDLLTLEQDFIANEKKQLRVDVSSLQANIASRNKTMQSVLENNLQVRVQEALKTAENIHSTMKSRLTVEMIEDVIKEAIRPIRFNDKQGYCFILRMDGEVILYPADTNLEGANFFSSNIYLAPEVMTEMIELVKAQSQGFLHYNWFKPHDLSGQFVEKISYVALFEPLGWIIGTGEYFDNLDSLTRKTVTNELKESLQGDIPDYFFIYELNNMEGGKDFATMLINNNRPDLVGQPISDDYVDAKGKQFRKEFLKGIRDNGEAYVVYWYKKTDGSGDGRKLSYFKFYPEWNWVIAKGVYFDRLDEAIATKKEALSAKVTEDIKLLVLIFFGGVALALFAAFFLSKWLQRIFNNYRHAQEEYAKQLETLNNALEKQSQTDALTRINNRGYFNEQLDKEIASAGRYPNPVSLILFDIDNFKLINDTLGHLAGDSVLRELAALIRDNIRQTDIFARWGGEEFVILVPNINIEQAAKFSEKLRKTIVNNTFSIGRNITCSFGVSTYRPPEKIEDLLQRTDEALYRAKDAGKNRCMAC